MTIRKKWIFTIGLISIISIVVNSLVLSVLTNGYFSSYLEEDYQKNRKEITAYLEKELKKQEYSNQLMQVELESYLGESITKIKVYDNQGNLIVKTEENFSKTKARGSDSMSGMMSEMMSKMDSANGVVDQVTLMNKEVEIGQLQITRYSTSGNSYAAKLFQIALFRNSFISVGVVLLLVMVLGFFMSKRVSRDLIDTAEMADNINLGKNNALSFSKTKEIRIIQERLSSLESRLKLKQQARKTLVDEMIHQTRTPLTILKMHLEGVQDGVIEMNPEEIKVCEDQIDNLSDIITNIGSLIEAKSQKKSVNVEEIDLNSLIKQIIQGMKTQFYKKQIELKLLNNEKILFYTDRYLLGQSLYNILNNSYKFTPEKGIVTVEYRIIPEGAEFVIHDTGCGIEAENLERIFDAYYKKDRASGFGGDGIGLYVAKENIESLGGEILVTSEPGRGSSFRIILPLQKDETKEKEDDI